MLDWRSAAKKLASVSWRLLVTLAKLIEKGLISMVTPAPPDDPHDESVNVKRYPWAYWGVWIVFVIVTVILMSFFPELRYWILAAAVALVAVSSRIPGAEYRGFVMAAGFPAINTWSGPVPLVPGLMVLHKVREYPPQWQFPADPEHVFNGDDELPLPIHPDGRPMVRPLRLITGPAREGYSHPTLNAQITTKATGSIRARVRNAIDFWVRHNGNTAEEKLAEAEKQLNDTWLQGVKAEWGKRPAGLIIDEDAEILDSVKKRVDKDARPRGLDIYELTVLHPDLSHKVSTDLAGIISASAQAISTKTNADAKKYNDVRDAEAKAEAKRLDENADSDAIAYRAKALGMQPRELIALEETTKIVGDKTQFIFGADGVAQAMGTGLAVLDKIRRGETDPKPDAT